ncbi:hypothetical protein [Dactylosporangium sp. NPDC000521]|uniref:hypothetical protein n=1 Tax=Dactylosporangium sp. NPDC000521 TaxID=3363975 RepID=UPI00369543A2
MSTTGLPTSTGAPGYHSPADTPDRVEAAALTAVARLVVAAGWLIGSPSATVSSQVGEGR